jgi:hypothetical protein
MWCKDISSRRENESRESLRSSSLHLLDPSPWYKNSLSQGRKGQPTNFAEALDKTLKRLHEQKGTIRPPNAAGLHKYLLGTVTRLTGMFLPSRDYRRGILPAAKRSASRASDLPMLRPALCLVTRPMGDLLYDHLSCQEDCQRGVMKFCWV